jgi:uncharacterized membrane protein YhaH (DUF805 family)
MSIPDRQNDPYRQHLAYSYRPATYTEGARVGPIAAVKGAFANCINFEGRASRSAYWWFQLFSLTAWVIVDISWALLHVGHAGPALLVIVRASPDLVIIVVVGLIALLPTTYSLTVRRLHDSDRSGWWLLFGFIPVVGTLRLLALVFLPGTPSPNRYG